MTLIPGVGPQYPQPDPRGWLVFDGLPNALQNAEDATALADYNRAAGPCTGWFVACDPATGKQVRYFERDATVTERALLAHLGYTLPEELVTRVHFRTETLRQRRWPALEPAPDNEGETDDQPAA